jgi:hypothetical protein
MSFKLVPFNFTETYMIIINNFNLVQLACNSVFILKMSFDDRLS